MMTEEVVGSQVEVRFSGFFTPFWRRRFQEHRRGLGVGVRRLGEVLGEVLGVSGETIRKWESGRSLHCHCAQRRRVRDFLTSRYDGRLRSLATSRSPVHRRLRKLPLPLRKCFARAWLVYAVALCHPREGCRFLMEMERLLGKTEEKLLRGSLPLRRGFR
ncbi:MAG: hypothetical protein ACI4SG_00370 [Oligosphaeraceae bacterium]